MCNFRFFLCCYVFMKCGVSHDQARECTYMSAERLLASTMFIMRRNPLWSLTLVVLQRNTRPGPEIWMQTTLDAQQKEPFWHHRSSCLSLFRMPLFATWWEREQGTASNYCSAGALTRNRIIHFAGAPDTPACGDSREKFHLFAAGVRRLWFAYGKKGCTHACAAVYLGRGQFWYFDSYTAVPVTSIGMRW